MEEEQDDPAYVKMKNWIQKHLTTRHNFVVALVCIAIVVLAYATADPSNGNGSQFARENKTTSEDTSGSDGEDPVCEGNVASIAIIGGLDTYYDSSGGLFGSSDDVTTESSDVINSILKADEDPNIKAIYFTVDSGGGTPVAGEEIMAATTAVEKPTIAVIRSTGASAAYLAISHVDHIFASKNSDVGGIGVILSFTDKSIQNQKDGITYHKVSSGAYKGMYDPDKPFTKEEEARTRRDVDISYNNFIADVAEGRHLETSKVRAMADGSTMLGVQAKELGLVDEIGTVVDARAYIEDLIGEEAVICKY